MFSRWVMADTELGGVEIPAGSVVHLAIGAANRDPRPMNRPDEYDISRKFRPSLAFGQGSHICLGMHGSGRDDRCDLRAPRPPAKPTAPAPPTPSHPDCWDVLERGATARPVHR